MEAAEKLLDFEPSSSGEDELPPAHLKHMDIEEILRESSDENEPAPVCPDAAGTPPQSERRAHRLPQPCSPLLLSRIDYYAAARKVMPAESAVLSKAVCVASSGSHLIAVGDLTGCVLLFDRRAKKATLIAADSASLGCALRFGQEGLLLFVGCRNGAVKVFATASDREVARVSCSAAAIVHIEELGDTRFATVDARGAVRLWAPQPGLFTDPYNYVCSEWPASEQRAATHIDVVECGGRQLLALCCVDELQLLEVHPRLQLLDTRRPAFFSQHSWATFSQRHAGPGRLLLAAGSASTVTLYDVEQHRTLQERGQQFALDVAPLRVWLSDACLALVSPRQRKVSLIAAGMMEVVHHTLEGVEVAEDAEREALRALQVSGRVEGEGYAAAILDCGGTVVELGLVRWREYLEGLFASGELEEAAAAFLHLWDGSSPFFADFVKEDVPRRKLLASYLRQRLSRIVNENPSTVLSHLPAVLECLLTTEEQEFTFGPLKSLADKTASERFLAALEPFILEQRVRKAPADAVVGLCQQLISTNRRETAKSFLLGLEAPRLAAHLPLLQQHELFDVWIALAIRSEAPSLEPLLRALLSAAPTACNNDLLFNLLESCFAGPASKAECFPIDAQFDFIVCEEACGRALFARDWLRALNFCCWLLRRFPDHKRMQCVETLTAWPNVQKFSFACSLLQCEVATDSQRLTQRIPDLISQIPTCVLPDKILLALLEIAQRIPKGRKTLAAHFMSRALQLRSPAIYSFVAGLLADEGDCGGAVDFLLSAPHRIGRDVLFQFAMRHMHHASMRLVIVSRFRQLVARDLDKALMVLRHLSVGDFLHAVGRQLEETPSLRLRFSRFVLQNFSGAKSDAAFLYQHAQLLLVFDYREELIGFLEEFSRALRSTRISELLSLQGCHYELGRLFLLWGQPEQAAAHLFAALKHFHQRKSERLIGKSLQTLARTLDACDLPLRLPNETNLERGHSRRRSSVDGSTNMSLLDPQLPSAQDVLTFCVHPSHSGCISMQGRLMAAHPSLLVASNRSDIVEAALADRRRQIVFANVIQRFWHKTLHNDIAASMARGCDSKGGCEACGRPWIGSEGSLTVKLDGLSAYHVACIIDNRKSFPQQDCLIAKETDAQPVKSYRRAFMFEIEASVPAWQRLAAIIT